MKRIESDLDYFSIINMLDRVARETGRDLGDEATSSDVLSQVSAALSAHKKNPMRLHGLRVQAMFAHMAAALGKCKIITAEDSGTIFTEDADIRSPDFRIVTADGAQFLVEVKNCHNHNMEKPYRLKSAYLESLKKYAHCMGLPLKIAIFWSRWRVWTMLDVSSIACASQGAGVTMFEAIKKNEMAILGDMLLGTIPPLVFRVYADQTQPCTIGPDGEVPFTISDVAFYAGGNRIEEQAEKDLAWFFILYSQWAEIDTPVEIVNGKLKYMEFCYAPDKADPNTRQGFELLGFLSSMISAKYAKATGKQNQVSLLNPTVDADKLGVTIPDDYSGKVLKLWQFTAKPLTTAE